MSQMPSDVEYADDGAQQGDERPVVKRKLSRLHHMTVSKVAAGEVGQLMHKGPDATNRGSPARVDQRSILKSAESEDASDDAEAKQHNFAGSTVPSPVSQQQQGHLQAQHGHSLSPAQRATDSISSEIPSVLGAADAMLPSLASCPANVHQSPQRTSQQPFRINMDDEDDDDWEDQPAGANAEAAGEADGAAGQAVAQLAATEESLDVAAYDPSHRRRKLYDDEDEWEHIVLKEKQEGQEAVSDVQDEEQDEKQQPHSASGSDIRPADDEDILAEDPDTTNAATQRLLRETAARDALGKGFKPEVAPVNNLLARLAARQAALEARAKQRAPPAEAAQSQQPLLTLEQLKAHLEQHSIGGKHQQNPAPAGAHTASYMAPEEADTDPAAPMEDMCDGNDCDADMDDDELLVEPAKQPVTGTAADMLPPDTQQLIGDMPSLPVHRGKAAEVFEETQPSLGSAPGLELQLGEDVEIAVDQQAHSHDTDAPMSDAAAPTSPDTCRQQEEAVSASHDDGEEVMGSSEVESLEDDEDNSESLDEPGNSESLAEPEPLHWEEEEDVAAGPDSRQHTESAVGQAGGGMKGQSSKISSKVRQYRAAGGFIEAEADLSDEEGQLGGEDSDDEEFEDDGMLAELIAEVKEGRMDESRRADLHAKWLAGKDVKEMNELLEALKRGFRRKRKAGAGLDDDEDDGTDAAARRRRAQLLGTLDEEEDDNAEAAGTDRLKRLDFVWKEEESDLQAATAAMAAELANRDKQKKIQELQQASEAQDGDDVVQLLHMDMVDEDSQHTAALLSRSIFATAAAHASDPVSSAAMQFGAGLSRAPSSKLKHQTGPGKEPSSAVSRGADAAADSFTFQMFGKDLTNSSRQPGAKQHQVAGSFIGRQASSSVTVRAASNYGASRSFVFGSDPSNHSNSGANKEQQNSSKSAAGPASFAGLSKLIAEAAPKGSNPSRLGAGSGGQTSSLLQMLGPKKGAGTGSDPGSAKLHMDAVGAKFRAVGENKGTGNSNAATSRGGPWQF